LVRSDKGFVLPLSVAVGAILMLLGVMMIMRASQGDKTAIAAKFNSRSQSVAEGSLTTFQSLMSRYKALSTYSYCSTDDPVSVAQSGGVDPNCSSPPPNTKTWSNVSDKDFCGTREKDNQLGKFYADLVKDYATDFHNNEWQVQDGGKYRLVRYIYTADTGTTSSTVPRRLGSGQLLVESEIEQDNTISNVNTPSKNPTTRLEVSFENWLERINDPNSLPTIWINSNGNSGAVDTVNFSTTTGFSIWDSTPTDDCVHEKAKELRDRLASADDTYRLMPELPFPTLPAIGRKPSPTPGTGVYTVPPIVSSLDLPDSGQIANNNTITYVIPSINLSSGELINITQADPSSFSTIALFVNGNLNIEEGAKIAVEDGIQLVIYAHGSVTLNSQKNLSNSIKAIDSSSVTKLFSYADEPIVIRGDSEIKLFVLAPRASVTFENNAKVSGAVWARSWVGGDSTSLVRELPTNILSQLSIDIPRMRPISFWQRCTVAAAPEYCPENKK
jgi:hypothetical protein